MNDELHQLLICVSSFSRVHVLCVGDIMLDRDV